VDPRRRSRAPGGPAVLRVLVLLAALAAPGCEEAGPSPQEIQDLVEPHLGAHVSGPSARAAIRNLLPEIVDDLRNGSPPTPSAARAEELADEYLAEPWEVPDPGDTWERLAPGPGGDPPAPGEP